MGQTQSIERFHISEVAKEMVYSGVHARFFRDGGPSFVVIADTKDALEAVLESIGKKFEPSSDMWRHDVLILSPHSKIGRAVVALSDINDPDKHIATLTSERDAAIRERDAMRNELKKLIEFVLTARGTNTHEWMESLCETLDHAASQIGEPIKAFHDKRNDIIRFAALSQSQQGGEKKPAQQKDKVAQ